MNRALLAALLVLYGGQVNANEAGELGSPPQAYISPADKAAVRSPDAARPQQPPGEQLPLQPGRRISFETNEGTWMSLDLAPDGRSLVFDLLGDLYTLDAGGGRAKRISGGMAVDAQPTFSPDGRWIAYVSDRSGAENIWLSRPDGSEARQISFGADDTVLVSPAWSVDGRSVLVSRYRPSLNGYELWRHALDGGAELLVPIRSSSDAPRDSWTSSLGAAASPDGRFIYFARRHGSLSFEDVDEWTIVRRNVQTGAEETIVAQPDGPGKAQNPGAAFRPAISPNGELLAYARRLDGQTELRVRDLVSGADRRLAFPIQRDQLQASMWQDIVPRYAFTRDGKALVISRHGRLERIYIEGGASAPIPFTAAVDLALGPSTRVDVPEERGPVRARLIQTPEASPDGNTLAFSAMGRLYLMALDGRSEPRLLQTSGPAYHPSWSPDGRQLAFITWTARAGGHVWIAPLDGSLPPRPLTSDADFYTRPVFSPDGRSVIAVRSSQAARMQVRLDWGEVREARVIAIPVGGGAQREIVAGRLGGKPQFTNRRGVIYLPFGDGLHSVDVASGAHRRVVQVVGPGYYFQHDAAPVDALRISPDGKWLLAQTDQQLHVLAMPPADQAVVDLSDPELPHRRITDIGADFFEWADGGRTISWSVGPVFHRRALADVTLNPADRPGWAADAPAPGTGGVSGYRATVTAPRATPHGSVLLRGGRAITMAGDLVIEDADILITDGRIAAIGPRGGFPVPRDAQVRHVTGKTVTPGFVDSHDHIGGVRRGVLDLEDAGLRARLAYGVTTAFDPSTLSIDLLAYQDLLDAGLMVGPRLRSTGPALFSRNRFTSMDEVRQVLRRYRDIYRLGNIKQYRTGNRRTRQWIAQAARELGLQPATEGALAMKLDLSQLIDGFAGQEHALVAAPLGADMVELMSQSGASYTATLMITNGGPPALDQFFAKQDVHDDPKLRRFTPHYVVDQLALRGVRRRPAEYLYPTVAADVARVQRAGAAVGVGAHGNLPGLGFHWEMEAHAEGGMRPEEILRAATIGGAMTIGRAADLGSLEQGKLADLLILREDPRQDIGHARAIDQVMIGGRLYDAETLDELWPQQRPLAPAWYVTE